MPESVVDEWANDGLVSRARPGVRFRPVAAALVPGLLADRLDEAARRASAEGGLGTALRVAVDGPRCAAPDQLADSLIEPLRALGRPVTHVRAKCFLRDAALRLEYGRTDVESFATGWLDANALRREVLDPLGPHGDGRFLEALRDPVTNRAIRAPRHLAETGSIVLVSGGLLLGYELPFDRSIHLAVGSAARRRRTEPEWLWTLPAFDTYDLDVEPARHADIVLRYDDPAHPAIRVDGADSTDRP